MSSSDPRRPATVLHTSDCHLGTSPNGREEVAFEQAMALARSEGVDAVLIAGDLFDNARVADDVLTWTAAQLDAVPCPVVVMPGNHDVLAERSVYHRFDIAGSCPRVQFIDSQDGQLVEIDGTDIVVWGRAMAEHEPGSVPSRACPGRPPTAGPSRPATACCSTTARRIVRRRSSPATSPQ